MDIGMIGLGRMGANMARRLLRDGHRVVVYDLDSAVVAACADEGAVPAASLDELCSLLEPPRAAWVMVPAGVAGAVIEDVAAHLEDGDIVVDGGNSFYQDDLERAASLAGRGIRLVDVGTSGGVFGLERGYCQMIGGDDDASPASIRSSARWHPASTPPTALRAGRARSRPQSTVTCTVVPWAQDTS
jgi:6-phosphogluconate dehydrogenase